MFKVRNSPVRVALSGTVLRVEPPSMVPMLNVVSSSSLPCGRRVMISEATRMADMPFSGSMPA